MADESDFSAVVADVELLAQTTLNPTMTTEEVEAVVRETARGRTWAAATAYPFGAYVIPTAANLNGRRYRVTEAGTSGAAEPAWPDSNSATLTDGTVKFEEAGPHTGSVYDKRRAVEKCLTIRLTKAANQTQYINDARGQASDYLFLNLQRLRDSFKPLDLA